MGIKISDLIVKATTQCKKGFSCLAEKTGCMCKAISSSPDHTVVIKPSSSDPCNYHRIQGNAHYCLCPVRNDIYNRYKI